MLSFRRFISIFVILTACCMITACGGGGGGGNDSNSGGEDSNLVAGNQVVQGTAVSNILYSIRRNIGHLFSASMRAKTVNAFRASVYDYEDGSSLTLLAKATGFVSEFNDSVSKFKDRFSESDIIYTDNSSIIVAKSGVDENNIGLIVEQNGSVKMTTYFVTNDSEPDILGTSYIRHEKYSYDSITFCFKMRKDLSSMTGKIFYGEQYDVTWKGNENNANGEGKELASISGDSSGKFTFISANGAITTIDYKGVAEDSGDFSYLEKFPETVAIRYAINPIRENASRISGFSPASSLRADVNVTDDLRNYNTLAKLKELISAESIADFNKKYTNHEQIIKDQNVSDFVVPSGIINMSIGKDAASGLTVGLVVEIASVTMKVNGQQQTFNDNTKIWFVVDPTSKAIVAFAYSFTGDAKSSGTYIFRVNADGTELEGKSFWNGDESYFPNATYDGDLSRNSAFAGDDTKFVYVLYNSERRNEIEGTVTLKYDGTEVK